MFEHEIDILEADEDRAMSDDLFLDTDSEDAWEWATDDGTELSFRY